MIKPAAGSNDVVLFGPFSLDPRHRLLLKDGAPIVVGARTLDTLIALVARPNEAIGKRELMAVVWPDVTVEEGSLRGQIAALGKALGDGKRARATSRRSPDGATASSRRSRGYAIAAVSVLPQRNPHSHYPTSRRSRCWLSRT